jgi:GAF domain-containing protein
MQPPDTSVFMNGVAEPDHQPAATYSAMCVLADQTVGHTLFTLTAIDQNTGGASRIYSNMPRAYPTFGTKPGNVTNWHRQVIGDRRTFVANTIKAIADVFDDFELINSLGCQSVINVPVTIGGRVVGTINCLNKKGHYTPDRVAAAEALRLPGALCFLLDAKPENFNEQLRDRT